MKLIFMLSWELLNDQWNAVWIEWMRPLIDCSFGSVYSQYDNNKQRIKTQQSLFLTNQWTVWFWIDQSYVRNAHLLWQSLIYVSRSACFRFDIEQ